MTVCKHPNILREGKNVYKLDEKSEKACYRCRYRISVKWGTVYCNIPPIDLMRKWDLYQ